MIFINTRPSHRAATLTHALQAQGLTVLDLPLLELLAIEPSEREHRYQQAFIHATPHQPTYQVLIVISPSAAKFGLAACPQGLTPSFKPRCPVIAVGNATAQVLIDAGWHVSCPLESSNQGILQMPILTQLGQNDRVLIWRGRGGRRLLVNQLCEKGVMVNAIEWYQRQCPTGLHKKFADLLSQLADNTAVKNKPTVLISSGEAFKNWQRLFTATQSYRLTDFNYLAFGKRLTAIVHAVGLRCERIDGLAAADVWQGINRMTLN